MIDNQILISTHRQARLQAAQEAFFQSGGKVEEVAGFEFKPKPPRKHPEPGEKKPRGIQNGARQGKYSERAAIVQEMAQTMTCREVSDSIGVPQTTLWNMAQREGFKFAADLRGKPNAHAEDHKLIERITALRDVGLTRHQVEKQMGIGSGTLRRIIDDYGIDFPKFRNRVQCVDAEA